MNTSRCGNTSVGRPLEDRFDSWVADGILRMGGHARLRTGGSSQRMPGSAVMVGLWREEDRRKLVKQFQSGKIDFPKFKAL